MHSELPRVMSSPCPLLAHITAHSGGSNDSSDGAFPQDKTIQGPVEGPRYLYLTGQNGDLASFLVK